MKPHILLRHLPADLSRGIGRIIFAYAYLECELQQIMQTLTGLGPKEGRLTIKEPRAIDRLEIIENLISIHGLEITIDKKFAKLLRQATSDRNLFAHAVWSKSEAGDYLAISSSGSHEGVSRKVSPQGIITDAESMHAFEQELAELTTMPLALKIEVWAGLQSSPRKPR
jgi:hypothetical protein